MNQIKKVGRIVIVGALAAAWAHNAHATLSCPNPGPDPEAARPAGCPWFPPDCQVGGVDGMLRGTAVSAGNSVVPFNICWNPDTGQVLSETEG